jgi:predicted glycosyltransferase
VCITGPFMPKKQRDKISERARWLGVRTWKFYARMEEIIAAADLVVSMGGYNTVCEVLTQGTVALIIPRENPRKEQLIRAQMFSSLNMVDYIPLDSSTPQLLREKILDLLEHPEPYKKAVSQFRMTGFEIMRQRLQAFRDKEA